MNIKNKIDFYLLISFLLLILTGAFLRFSKYFFLPETTEKITYILIPETGVFFTILAIKTWRK